MKSEMRTITLPDELCNAAESKYRQRFAGIEELVTAVLQELVKDDAAKMDEADRRMIEERLKDLGYL